ncbi:MAG: SRPBCC domain-containing protein [Pseudomonadota bacterium]
MPEGRGYAMSGTGETLVPIAPDALLALIMDEARLAAAIPGADDLHRADEDGVRAYAADVGIGVGRMKGTYRVTCRFDEVDAGALTLTGGAKGPFGHSSGEGFVDLDPAPGGTLVRYTYAILIKGVVAAAGGRLLDGAGKLLIEKFFRRLAAAAGGEAA